MEKKGLLEGTEIIEGRKEKETKNVEREIGKERRRKKERQGNRWTERRKWNRNRDMAGEIWPHSTYRWWATCRWKITLKQELASTSPQTINVAPIKAARFECSSVSGSRRVERNSKRGPFCIFRAELGNFSWNEIASGRPVFLELVSFLCLLAGLSNKNGLTWTLKLGAHTVAECY